MITKAQNKKHYLQLGGLFFLTFSLLLFSGCTDSDDKNPGDEQKHEMQDTEKKTSEMGKKALESSHPVATPTPVLVPIKKIDPFVSSTPVPTATPVATPTPTPVAIEKQIPTTTPPLVAKVKNPIIIPNMNTHLQKDLPQADDDIALIKTNKGDIYLRFFPEEAPKTVENFVGLAKKGYYNGIIFHRIIDGFMLQGGDPTGTGRGGESFWGGKFEDEFSDTVSNAPYSIAMANAGPGTNGSQFFINQANNNFLDGRHTVFGEVLLGTAVVEDIMKVKTGAQDKPLKDVVMNSVEIVKFSTIADEMKK